MRTTLGDPDQPLLLSVRSGAPVSMPGMMDTVLNLGVNRVTSAGLARLFGDERFALDAHRRFLEGYGTVVLGIDGEHFAAASADAESVEALRATCEAFEALIERESGVPVPDAPHAQLSAAIAAVFGSWESPRARAYREIEGIPDDLGTAVVVQAMVFGNLDDRSGTGVAFTRDPNTGEPVLYGDFLFRAQGEDVVSGSHQTLPLSALAERLPRVHAQLSAIAMELEHRVRDMCDIEFTVESDKLYVLQTRSAKRAAVAAIRVAVDMADEGLIDRKTAVQRVSVKQLKHLDRPYLDPAGNHTVLATGLGASPGCAMGRICLDPDRVHEMSLDGPVLLVRTETSPHDVHGMALAEGILTARGGLVSHAALVARDMGIPAVVGVGEIEVDYEARQIVVAGKRFREGSVMTIDGSTGEVVAGGGRVLTPVASDHLTTLLAWADELSGTTDPAQATPSQRLAAAHEHLSEHPLLAT